MAASRPKEEAEAEGAVLVRTLSEVIHEARSSDQYGGPAQEYFDPAHIARAVSKKVKASEKLSQTVNWEVPAGEDRLPRFFRNPRYRSDLPSTLDLETERRLLANRDLIQHWGPRARGVEIEAAPGWLFSGRTRALTELVAYIRGATGRKTRVVTGGPGSGKSAVLARLVTLADPVYRRKVPLDVAPAETIPPQDAIDVAIHAHRKSTEAVAAEIATIAGIAETETELVVNALATRTAPLVVVVDALDEALDPERLARQLLRPLTRVESVRLLVGTRRPLLVALGPGVEVLDLDQPTYLDTADLALYAERILLGAGDPAIETPYREKPEIARRVAQAVADRAHPTFLIARLVAATLAERAEPINITEHGWEEHFPASVGDALDEYLARFGPDEERVRALLRPLAYAEGAGMPWEDLWASLASALAGRDYTDADIDWLQRKAGAYILRTVDASGRTAYRLFHESLAEHLRSTERGPEDQRRMVETMKATAPDRTGGKDWAGAPVYVRRHLAAHAAMAGNLDDLLVDPGYLLAADPPALLAVLSQARSQPGRRAADAYRRVAHHLSDASEPARDSYLALAALQVDAKELMHALDPGEDLSDTAPWHPLWAWWRLPTPSRMIGQLPAHASAVAVIESNEGVMGVAGGSFGLDAWEVTAGQRVSSRAAGDVWCLAGANVGGQPLVVAGYDDGTVTCHGLPLLEPVARRAGAHKGRVRAATALPGTEVVVTGGADGALILWRLPELERINARHQAHTNVEAITTAELSGRGVLVTAGDTIDEQGRPTDIASVRVWQMPTLQLHGELGGGRNVVQAVGAVSAPPACIVLIPFLGRIEIARVTPGGRTEPLGAIDGWLERCFVLQAGPEPEVLIYANGLLVPLQLRTTPGNATAAAPAIEAESGSWTGVANVNGRRTLLSATHNLRLWDVDDVLATSPESADLARTQKEHGVEALSVAGDVLAALTSTGRVRRWEWRSPEGLDSFAAPDATVEAIASCDLDERPHLVMAYRDGIVAAFDATSGERRPTQLELQAELQGLAVGRHRGSVVAATAAVLGTRWDRAYGSDKKVYGVRLWDLLSGTEIETRRRLFGEAIDNDSSLGWKLSVPGYSDWPFGVIEVFGDGDRSFIAAGSDRSLQVWSLDDIDDERGTNRASPITALAGEGGLLVAAGWRGEIELWRIDDWGYTTRIGHHSEVRGLLLGRFRDEPAVYSGGSDGWLRIWSLTGEQMASVQVDERITALASLPDDHIAVGTRRGLTVLRL
jgi:WD40 repeat protein